MHILRYVNYSSNHALISIFSVCGCGTIKVTLSQKAQTTITLPNLQGLYEESATVNGRSSWISTNKLYAIWYHPDFKDWMMGLSKEIGTRWLVRVSFQGVNPVRACQFYEVKMYFSLAKFNFSPAKFLFRRRKKIWSSRWHGHYFEFL